MNYLRNFSEKPSYLKDLSPIRATPYSPIEDVSNDPVFKVTSKKPYQGEIVTRGLVWDYYRTQLALPETSDVLIKLGKNIEEVDQLLCDGRVKAAYNNRRAGVLSLKWTLDQNEAPSRVMKLVSKVFEAYPMYDILGEMMMAPFYGYNVSEVVWEYKDGYVVPTNLTGKAQRWFVYSDKNELRVKSKVEQVQGEELPPRKFLVTRYHPRYDDPYAGREALFNACYWPVIWRRIIFQYAMQFLDKYGMPWIDVTTDDLLQKDRLTEIVDVLKQTFQDGILAHPSNTKLQKMEMDDAKTIDNYINFLDAINREIDMSILGCNLMTEVKGGSYAAANTQAGVRDDIIKEDIRMLEATMNQLIEWIAWFNCPIGIKLPKFRMYKSEPPTKERAEIDIMISKLGIKLNKAYYARTYGLNDDEFEVGAPVQTLTPGAKGDVAGALPDGQEPAVSKPDDSNGMSKSVTEATIETKDQVSNSQTNAAIIKQQGKGYMFAEKEGTVNVIFVRHGETEMNKDGDKIRGWRDIALDEKGQEQAEKTARKLSKENADYILSSDLIRTHQTAQKIADKQGMPVISTKALRPGT